MGWLQTSPKIMSWLLAGPKNGLVTGCSTKIWAGPTKKSILIKKMDQPMAGLCSSLIS